MKSFTYILTVWFFEFQSWQFLKGGQVSLLPFDLICQGLARTQTPTLIYCVPESCTSGMIARISQTGVQWKGLILEEPPFFIFLFFLFYFFIKVPCSMYNKKGNGKSPNPETGITLVLI